jgi:hemoglobin-like flavoprotein
MTIDTARLQMSWADAAQYGDQVPLFFYSRLFITHPELRDMFPLSMEAQRGKLVAALGSVASGVDDLPAIVPLLELGRDHRRFAVVRDHYPAVDDALLAALEHFLGDDWTPELAADWTRAHQVVADVMIAAADTAGGDSPPWYEATVADIERCSGSVAVLRVTPSVEIPYLAGQSLATEIPARPRMWRSYSPATLPDETGSFERHVRAVGGGAVSTALVQATRQGDQFRFGAPVGRDLTLGDRDSDLALIAGGTGLALSKPSSAKSPPTAATAGGCDCSVIGAATSASTNSPRSNSDPPAPLARRRGLRLRGGRWARHRARHRHRGRPPSRRPSRARDLRLRVTRHGRRHSQGARRRRHTDQPGARRTIRQLRREAGR